MRLFETTLARIAAMLCLALLVLLPQVGNAQTAYQGFYRIVAADCNLALDKTCNERPGLHNENGGLSYGGIQPNWWSAQWEILDAGQGQFNIRNRYTGEYLAATFNPDLPVGQR